MWIHVHMINDEERVPFSFSLLLHHLLLPEGVAFDKLYKINKNCFTEIRRMYGWYRHTKYTIKGGSVAIYKVAVFPLQARVPSSYITIPTKVATSPIKLLM